MLGIPNLHITTLTYPLPNPLPPSTYPYLHPTPTIHLPLPPTSPILLPILPSPFPLLLLLPPPFSFPPSFLLLPSPSLPPPSPTFLLLLLLPTSTFLLPLPYIYSLSSLFFSPSSSLSFLSSLSYCFVVLCGGGIRTQ